MGLANMQRNIQKYKNENQSMSGLWGFGKGDEIKISKDYKYRNNYLTL